MSEMIERVAEALMKARHPDVPLTYAEVVLAVSLGSDPTVLEGFRRDARAAIESMRELSDKQIDVGWGAYRDSFQREPKMQTLWGAMIDAALDGSEQVRTIAERSEPCALSVSDGDPKGEDREAG